MSLRTLTLAVLALTLGAFGCVTNVSGGGDGDGNEEGDGGGDGGEDGGEGGNDEAGALGAPTKCETPERACEASGGWSKGIQYCVLDAAGQEVWTECCGWGDSPTGTPECECPSPWSTLTEEDCITPLVLAFENETVRYTTEMAGSFDLTGVGMSVATDWPTSTTPWLALDRDGNGQIDGGGELFGSATVLPTGARASNGFIALAALDDNKDGRIDASDAVFVHLVLWRDTDASRTSEPHELSPASAELASIDLGYTMSSRCDERGNCEVERAPFRFLDASGRERTGTVIDVHLRTH